MHLMQVKVMPVYLLLLTLFFLISVLFLSAIRSKILDNFSARDFNCDNITEILHDRHFKP